jgi:cell wall-associated NlpC family hydrolase/LysM repeat protein
MKYLVLVVISFFCCSNSVFSQDKNKKHSVAKGESISSIAHQYNVKVEEICKLNPEASGLLKVKQIILIPIQNSRKQNGEVAFKTQSPAIVHEVLAKETVYGIARKYGLKVSVINGANPILECEGLKVGQKINVPTTEMSKVQIAAFLESNKAKDAITKSGSQDLLEKSIIVPVQTEAVVAKQEKVFVGSNLSQELKKTVVPQADVVVVESVSSQGANDKIVNPVAGKAVDNPFLLKEKKDVTPVKTVMQIVNTVLPQDSKKVSVAINEDAKIIEGKVVEVVKEKEVLSKAPTILQEEKTVTLSANQDVVHVVLSNETKYGIAKKYGITVIELESLNPNILKKLFVGDKLNIGKPRSIITKEPFKTLEVKSEIINKESIKTKSTDEKGASLDIDKVERGEVSETTNTNETLFFSSKVYSGDEFVEQLIKKASDNIGTRYRSGGTTSAGFDCSGLICSTFATFDVKMPRSSIEQSGVGVKINNDEAQKGDLIFFKTNGRGRINHVGMVTEASDGEIKFIHSSTHNGVIISSTKEAYYSKNFAQVNRVLQ